MSKVSLLQWSIPSGVIGVWSGSNPTWSAYEGLLAIGGDLWNTSTSSAGGVTISWDSNAESITTDVDLSSVSVLNPNNGTILGYPNVSYGQSPWGGTNTSGAVLQLPEQVSAIEQQQSLELYANYSIQNTNSVQLDFAYDMFLTTEEATGSSGGPTTLGSSLELMIWLDEQNGVSPAGTEITSFNFPTWINGQLETSTWNVYVGNGGSGTPLVTFELANPPSPNSSASVSVYLGYVLADLGSSAITGAIGSTWNSAKIASSYLNAISLGSEFFETSSSESYSWTLNAYDILSAPTVTAGGTVSYTSGGAPVALDTGLVVTDTGDSILTGATVSISSGFLYGDTLGVTSAPGITESYDSTSGVLTLTGTGTVADYQTALDSITYSSASTDATNGGADTSRTITWTVSDAEATSAPVTSTIDVQAARTISPPVVTGAGNTVTYTSGGPPVAIDTGLVITDTAESDLVGATISISSGSLTGDTLNFTNTGVIAGTYASGVLTLTGTATVANYQAALESITYSSSAADATDGNADDGRTVAWTVSDAEATSAPVTSTIDVQTTRTISPPVVTGVGNTVTYTSGGPPMAIDTGLVITDTAEADLVGATIAISSGFLAGDTLNFSSEFGIVPNYNSGVLTLSGTTTVANYQTALESISYSSSAADATDGGTDHSRTVTWTVSDAEATSAPVTSTIDVQPVPPSADYWTNSAGGDWTTVSDWSAGALPGVTSNVLIDAGGTYTVTLVAPGGYVAVASVSTARGATLSITYGGLALNDGTGSGDNAGTIQVLGGNLLEVAGLIDNTGTIRVTGANSALALNGQVTLEGGGAVVLTDNGIILQGGAEPNLINVDNTLTGSGTIAPYILTNESDGVIEASNTDLLMLSPNGFINAGTIEASEGGRVEVELYFTDTGLIETDGGYVAIEIGSGVSSDGTPDKIAGSAIIEGGGTLDILDPYAFVCPDTGSVTFVGTGGTLGLETPATFTGVIAGLAVGDVIDLGTTVTSAVASGSTLTVDVVGGTTLTYQLAEPLTSSSFVIQSDGQGGSDLILAAAPCFAAGTRISTERGEIAVEAIRVSDKLRVLLGDGLAPVIWLGRREVDCARHPRPRKVWPVRVSAGAFGPQRPHTDLFLSPDHAVYVEEVLIPVKYLINGSTIEQAPMDSVTYYHIELPRHGVLLAEGLPAESYLDTGDRSNFANGGGPAALYPDFASRVWEAEGCAPLVVTGPELVAVRRQLQERAQLISRQPRSAPRRLARARRQLCA